MLDTFGSIQHVALAAYLWLIPGLPLAAALVLMALGLADARRRAEQPKAPPLDTARLAQVAAVATGGSLAVTAGYTFVLAGRSVGVRYALDHVARLVRLGQLEASFDLALDPLAATVCLAVSGLGLAALLFAGAHMEREPPPGGAYRALAWTSFLIAATQLLVLADNLILLAFGWGGVSIAVWGLAAHRAQDDASVRAASAAAIVNGLGTGALLVAAAVIFWAFGGAWTEGDYAPDLNPRFAAVGQSAYGAYDPKPKIDGEEDEQAAPSLPAGGIIRDKSSVTLVSYPGALVYLDGSRTPLSRNGQPVRAPFTRVPVDVGRHTFRIHPGEGQDDHVVADVLMPSQGEVILAVIGGSVSFREIHDQLVLHSPKEEMFLRNAALAKRVFGKLGAITLAGLLFLFAALTRGAQLPLSGWIGRSIAAPAPARALVQGIAASSGVYLLARVALLLSLSPVASTVTACFGAATAIAGAAIAAHQRDLRGVLAYATVGHVGLMLLGIGVGAYAAGVFHLVTHAAFMGCLVLAGAMVLHRGRRDGAGAYALDRLGGLGKRLPHTERAYRVGCIAATFAPIPGLSGFWSANGVLVGAATSQSLAGVPGPALVAAGVLASGLSSFALWRSYFLVFDGPEAAPAKGKASEPGALVDLLRVLAVLAAVVGPILALVGRVSGGASLIEAWLVPSFDGRATFPSESGLPTEVAVGVVAAGFAIAGWSLARSAYGAARAKGWFEREPARRAHGALSSALSMERMLDAVAAQIARARDFVAEIDHLVIDGVVNAGGVLLRAAAWVNGRVDDGVVGAPANAIAERALPKPGPPKPGPPKPGPPKPGSWQPLSASRVQTAACLVVAALLGCAAALYFVSNG